MTPGARIQATIDLLERIEHPAAGEAALPADALLGAYFRGRRYIGAKDRRAIGDAVFQTLRQRGYVDWSLGVCGLPASNLFRALWTFYIHQDMAPEALLAACDGGPHRPPKLSDEDARRVTLFAFGQVAAPEALADQASFPAWLGPEIERRFGAEAWAEMLAFTMAAPTDLRVNTLKATPADVQQALAEAGIDAAPTPHSPWGLRLEGRATLPALKAFRDGWFEVQDEGSQLAALLCDARPGMRVLDLCAGAGGKTLALAAAMHGKGTLIASDIAAARLKRLAPRLARSGAGIVQAVPHAALGTQAGKGFDRVFVDAPCSGSGTWRRQPDAKWRLTAEALARYHAQQREVLAAAAPLVKPGGRLVYAVCSILPSEGEDPVARFLAAHADYRLLPAGPAWRTALGGEPPFAGDTMMLSPHRHKTDGFFAAVLERRP